MPWNDNNGPNGNVSDGAGKIIYARTQAIGWSADTPSVETDHVIPALRWVPAVGDVKVGLSVQFPAASATNVIHGGAFNHAAGGAINANVLNAYLRIRRVS